MPREETLSDIVVVLQHYSNNQRLHYHYAGEVDNGDNFLWVIEHSDFHISNSHSENKCSHLQIIVNLYEVVCFVCISAYTWIITK